MKLYQEHFMKKCKNTLTLNRIWKNIKKTLAKLTEVNIKFWRKNLSYE